MPPIRRNPSGPRPRPSRPVAGRQRVPLTPDAPTDMEPDEAAAAMGAPEGADTADAGPDLDTDRAPRRRVPTGVLVTGLIVGLVAGGTGLYLRTEPGITYSNQAFVEKDTTHEVSTAAASAVQRLVAIDYRRLDAWHGTLGEFLAPNLIADLDRSWPTLKDTYTQTKTVVDAKVSDVGVAHLQDDRAEVLVVQDVSMQRDGHAAGSTSGTYLVTLTRIDGVWKLSKIPDLPS